MNGDLTDKQKQIITLMEAEGRVSPSMIIDRINGIDYQQHANYHLRQLRDLGHVNRVAYGLYELADTPADVDPEGLQFDASPNTAGDER